MNARRAIAVAAVSFLLTIANTATPAYADVVVDLRALPATASGAAGETIAVTIAYEASAAISGTPPVVQLDVTFPPGVPIKEYAPGCQYANTFKARCLLDSVEPGHHELVFHVIMSNRAVATGTITLTLKASGYTDPTRKNNTASITLTLGAPASSSPSAASSPGSSAKPTPTPTSTASKQSSETPAETPGETPAETPGETPADSDSEAPAGEAAADAPSAPGVAAVTAVSNEAPSSLPVVIFGGAALLILVGGLLFWLILRRGSDYEDDEDDEDDELNPAY
jgi:hypothetical protein